MIHSFLMIGQSNMAGRGLRNEAIPVDTSHIKVLRNGRWQPMYRPVNNDRQAAGVSLAESFAEQYAKTYGVDVGLIPCADGGTCLEQWKPGSILFDHAVFQAKLAARTSTIVGILWHQGEGDCDTASFTTYQERFERMIASLRAQLDLPDVPVLVGGLGDFLIDCPLFDTLKNYGEVNQALKSVAAADPSIGFVPAEGLTSNPDLLHFNSKSLHEFGKRYFDVYQTLRADNTVIEQKPLETDTAHSEMERL